MSLRPLETGAEPRSARHLSMGGLQRQHPLRASLCAQLHGREGQTDEAAEPAGHPCAHEPAQQPSWPQSEFEAGGGGGAQLSATPNEPEGLKAPPSSRPGPLIGFCKRVAFSVERPCGSEIPCFPAPFMPGRSSLRRRSQAALPKSSSFR